MKAQLSDEKTAFIAMPCPVEVPHAPRSHADMMEQALASAVELLDLRPNVAGGDVGFDFATPDLHTILELKVSSAGPLRGLAARATQLALAASQPTVKRAILAWWSASFSPREIGSEWERVLSVFSAEIKTKLQLVLVSPANDVIYPADDLGRQVAAALRRAAAAVSRAAAAVPEQLTVSRPDLSYEVLKILLLRWLRGDSPIAMGELQAQTGLTHPTVAKRIRELGPDVERTSNRSVRLRAFPTRAWAELAALSLRVRQTVGFEDRSGRSGDLSALVVRIQRQRPSNVALGGVVGARHWQPEFDLVGIPRVDLELHAPLGNADLRFVSRIDPALVPARPEVAPVLAVHAVIRAVSLFEGSERALPWADPVEILLDLYQLKLHKQADDFIRFWRKQR